MFRRFTVFVVLALAVALLAACAQPTPTPAPAAPAQPEQPTPAPAPAVKELKILWAQWDPADYLQQIGNMYEQETGIKVTVVQEPWGSFYNLFATEMAAKGTTWDMVVGDSQWLGQMTTQGHYVDLTDFLTSTGLKDSVTPATLTYYGEYPTGSGRYWAYPTEGDANGWAYRKDLFEDPAEKEAFKAQYGYDLAPPKTYAQLMDIAKFFPRPDKGLYGVAIYTQKDYDAITMGVQNTMFSWGADWKDAKYNVMGVVNSPEAIEAVQFYRDLYDCCQWPGGSNAFFTETNDAIISGQVAMSMNYFAFFPALVNPGTNPNYYDKIGFFSNPAGPTGKQHAALGGQGMSIISYISPERKQAAMDFIKWFGREDIQAKWAELGGYTCNANVLKSDIFLKATPFNPAFAETMTFVKDFWNIPEYGQLLEVTQREFSKFIVEGVGTAKETMDTIATEHDKILRAAGYIK
ncbi:MAG: extracellular solute-binding protein [Caldilineales bacterium]|nr:extracellular solute-binding protein [Caldilineales bacterium]